MHRQYDAFGNIIATTGSLQVFWFAYTGRTFDTDTGLQYNNQRWYDALLGKWLSEDPIGFEAGDANLMRYVGNSVLSTSDPSGLAKNYDYQVLPNLGGGGSGPPVGGGGIRIPTRRVPSTYPRAGASGGRFTGRKPARSNSKGRSNSNTGKPFGPKSIGAAQTNPANIPAPAIPGTIHVTPGKSGVTFIVPHGYVCQKAINGKDAVFLPRGQQLGDNRNIIRYAEPTQQYPRGYFR